MSERAIHGPRGNRTRDRRGRGMRGPLSLPGPLSPRGLPLDVDRRTRFGTWANDTLELLSPAIDAAALRIEVVVEDAPQLPLTWRDPVPASIVTHHEGVHTIVLYRRPIHDRAASELETIALIQEVLTHRVAELLGVHPDDLFD